MNTANAAKQTTLHQRFVQPASKCFWRLEEEFPLIRHHRMVVERQALRLFLDQAAARI